MIKNNANSPLGAYLRPEGTQYYTPRKYRRICGIENYRNKVRGIKPIIFNTSKNRILEVNSKLCDGIFSKSIGLMLSKKQNMALIFKFIKERIISLHMFFVFYPIDVLFLNKNKIVVDKKESFSPFTFYKSRRKAMYAIELSNGTIKKTKTEIGDKIEF